MSESTKGSPVLIASLRTSAAVVCLILLAASSFAFVPGEEAAADSSTTTATAGTAGASGYDPPIQPASDEAARALSVFRVPEGMTASLVAAEPLLANPVAFWIDEQGRYWVCETFRQGNAVVDNRGRDYWLLDDLAAQTVEDRFAYHKKHLGEEGLKAFTEHHDRIRLLSDTDGDGKVDKATVFADGFNSVVEGTGAGVMTVGDDVYYTNIPNVWKLRDTNGDGVADERETLFSGFGVRVAFRGHDMHGLVMGPDGRIYFSIGDRGYNVVNKEGERLARPDTGAVFRCEPDGSDLEVYAYGLRNPQELAFDDYGNLFTGDNNSDSGDQARWVYVVEGSDSGWRMYYQYQDDRGPWNRELMWLPYETPAQDREIATGAPIGVAVKDIQPAYILPPAMNLSDGPSGLSYYPGVGLSDRYKGHFFLCDFRGTPNNSGVRSFAVKPNGAGFEVVDSHEFIWSILCTDADFAPDGRFVISDWVNGWNGEGKGRLYAFSDPNHADPGKESAKLLAEDFSQRSPEELIELFSHRDRRVRQKAHLALADDISLDNLGSLLTASKNLEGLGKLHFAWAVGIAARRDPSPNLTTFLGDVLLDLDTEFRPSVIAAYGEVLGDVLAIARERKWDEFKAATGSASGFATLFATSVLFSPTEQGFREKHLGLLEKLVLSGTPPERAASAIALGRAGGKDEIQTLAALAEDAGDDTVLRHAAMQGLTGIIERSDSAAEVAKLLDHENVDVRTAAVVALRRTGSARLIEALDDADPNVVTEAARAANDATDHVVPAVEQVYTNALASLAGHNDLNDPTLRRVLNANFRLGGKANAEAVAKVAANAATPLPLRIEAIEELKLWPKPPQTDRVTGMYRLIEKREASFVGDVVRPMAVGLLREQDAKVRTAAIGLVTAYRITEAVPTLVDLASNADRSDCERIAAIEALLATTGADVIEPVLTKAVEDKSAAVRSAARTAWAKHDPASAVPILDRTIASGETLERQAAIASLTNLGNEDADAVLTRWFDKFVSGQLPPEIGLDLLEAAEKREVLKGRLEAYQSGTSSGDPLAAWRVSLVGGNAEKGRDIFLNRAAVSCLRCHKVEDNRGGEVGPNLAKIGAEKDREYLLASIVTPNSKIAEGFESVVVVTIEGLVVTGVKRAEDDTSLTIITAEGKGIVIPKDEIDDRAVGQSAMPEDLLKHLSKRDVRDLVEYLATQKGQGRAGATEE